jgi:hypothetical protein
MCLSSKREEGGVHWSENVFLINRLEQSFCSEKMLEVIGLVSCMRKKTEPGGTKWMIQTLFSNDTKFSNTPFSLEGVSRGQKWSLKFGLL